MDWKMIHKSHLFTHDLPGQANLMKVKVLKSV